MNFEFLTPEYFIENQRQLSGELVNSKQRYDLPFVNYCDFEVIRNFPNESVVRFRGMIQDMEDHELYSETVEIRKDDSRRIAYQKYRDYIHLTEGETMHPPVENQKFRERKIVVCVTIPGINKWAENIERRISNIDQQESSNDLLDQIYLARSPIKSRFSRVFKIQLYEELENYQVGHVIDFVGFLSKFTQPIPNENGILGDENKLPFPVIHAISTIHLQNINPLEITSPVRSNNLELVYEDLVENLRPCLFNDALTTKYLICHLISLVVARSENSHPYGNFPLNITQVPDYYPELLYSVLETLVPASHYLQLTGCDLNKMEIGPRKMANINTMLAGEFQLAPNTLVVIDETKFSFQNLTGNSIAQINKLRDVIKNQQLPYKFEHFSSNFDIDLQFLVLSKDKSVLDITCELPLQMYEAHGPINEPINNFKNLMNHSIDDDIADIFRKFLSRQLLQQVDIKPGMRKVIEDEYVEKINDGQSNTEDLHSLLTVSKLLCKCKGIEELDVNAWTEAHYMDMRRKARLYIY